MIQGLTLACSYVLYDLHGIGSNSILKHYSVHCLNTEEIYIRGFFLKSEELTRLGLHPQLAKINWK